MQSFKQSDIMENDICLFGLVGHGSLLSDDVAFKVRDDWQESMIYEEQEDSFILKGTETTINLKEEANLACLRNRNQYD